MDALEQVRYAVEQYALPALLYSSGPMLLLRMMGTQGAEMIKIYNSFGEKAEGFSCPYAEADFTETHTVFDREDDSVLVIRIEMPQPEQVLQSRAVYLCYGQKGGDNLYVTSELNTDGGFFLCGRLEDDIHVNFGAAPETGKKELEKVAALFWEFVYGEQSEDKGLCTGES